MNKSRSQDPVITDNDHAINRVLRAEQAAQKVVAGCENRAQGILHAAQMQVQRITRRADERISWVEMRCARWLSEQGRQLDRENGVQPDDDGRLSESVLAEVVDGFAARLTGDETGAR
jgi:hypothetical protein